MRFIFFLILFIHTFTGFGQSYTYKMGWLKNNDGGDGYENRRALTNIIEF